MESLSYGDLSYREVGRKMEGERERERGKKVFHTVIILIVPCFDVHLKRHPPYHFH